MGVSKITRNFQVTIPEDIRELKDFKEGDQIIFMLEENDVKLVKKDNDIISETAGIWDTEREGTEIEREMRDEWEDRREREYEDDRQ